MKTKNLLLLGGAGLAAYLLLFRSAPAVRGQGGDYVGGAMAPPPPVWPVGAMGLGAPSSAAWRGRRR